MGLILLHVQKMHNGYTVLFDTPFRGNLGNGTQTHNNVLFFFFYYYLFSTFLKMRYFYNVNSQNIAHET